MLFVSSHQLEVFQKLRGEGLDALLATVKVFCVARNIIIRDMSARYVPRRRQAHHHEDEFQVEHYY